MNKTTNSTKKAAKIPEIKHFFDSGAARKVKKLAKKTLSSNLVKNGRRKSSTKKVRARTAELFDRVTDAPIAVQLSALAVVAAGSYMLWKNREKIQDFIKETGESVLSGHGKSDGATNLSH